jgi:hypothetical protein
MDTTGLINSQFDQSLEAQKAQLQAAYEKGKKDLETQLAQSGQQYQGLRNESYVNQALAERVRRENIANMGLAGMGGTSQSWEQRNQTGLLNNLGSISRQQQNYTDTMNNAITGLGTQYNADLTSATADINAQRNAALVNQSNADRSYNLSQRQLEQQIADNQRSFEMSQRQFEENQKDATFSRAYNLYANRLITAAQFEQMTGIPVQALPSGGGGGGGSSYEVWTPSNSNLAQEQPTRHGLYRRQIIQVKETASIILAGKKCLRLHTTLDNKVKALTDDNGL